MKAKCHPLLVSVLALALLCLMPGLVLVAQGAAQRSGNAAPVEVQTSQVSSDSSDLGADRHGAAYRADVPICQFIQRGFFGEVADGYIWSATPRVSYNNNSLYTGIRGSGETRSLIRFDLDFLPEGAIVQWALFGIWETSTGSGETVGIYRITEPWSEGEPMWNDFADSYDDSVEWSHFAAGGPGIQIAEVTGLVAAWAEGEVPNYGLLLKNSSGQASDRYASSETTQVYKPGLLVCYVVNHDPIAVDDTAVTDEDTPVDVDVLANDSDPDGDTLTVGDHDPASAHGGAVSCTSAGTCTYSPPDGFDGTDTFTYAASDGHGGAATATVTIMVTAAGPTEHLSYMPLVMKNHGLPSGPDLVVEHIAVTSDSALVVVKNQGDQPIPATSAFWVDLYVDPDPIPTGVNQTWSFLCSQGIAWGVTAQALPLAPGITLTLTLGDVYYRAEDSNFSGSLAAGTPIYVQVDSAHAETTYGAVLENHEMIPGLYYNNVSGPVFSTLNAMDEQPVGTEQFSGRDRPRAAPHPPPRP